MKDWQCFEVQFPAPLLEDMKRMAVSQETEVGELIRQAVRRYVKGEQRRETREFLKRGYQEMADLNLALAREAEGVDQDLWGRATNTFTEGTDGGG